MENDTQRSRLQRMYILSMGEGFFAVQPERAFEPIASCWQLFFLHWRSRNRERRNVWWKTSDTSLLTTKQLERKSYGTVAAQSRWKRRHRWKNHGGANVARIVWRSGLPFDTMFFDEICRTRPMRRNNFCLITLYCLHNLSVDSRTERYCNRI